VFTALAAYHLCAYVGSCLQLQRPFAAPAGSRTTDVCRSPPAAQFFVSGRQGQLGAEGFYMGTLYVAVGCSLAFLTYAAPRIASKPLRDITSLVTAGGPLSSSTPHANYQLQPACVCVCVCGTLG
jgi:hypothetical protein